MAPEPRLLFLTSVLVLQGRQDEYGTLAQVDAISRQVTSSQVLILEECGHTPHRDQPEQTLRAMHAFIAQLPSCVY